jgi:hypothetical protein
MVHFFVEGEYLWGKESSRRPSRHTTPSGLDLVEGRGILWEEGEGVKVCGTFSEYSLTWILFSFSVWSFIDCNASHNHQKAS